MQEYAQDAISYVWSYGRPDLFITFTCNPDWIEIREFLSCGQTPSDRQDLLARVFRQKQIKVIDVITKKKKTFSVKLDAGCNPLNGKKEDC